MFTLYHCLKVVDFECQSFYWYQIFKFAHHRDIIFFKLNFNFRNNSEIKNETKYALFMCVERF